MTKCLLIKMKNRGFLTSESNLPLLIEFCKTFSAEIHRVTPDPKEKIVSLKQLSTAFCSNVQKMPQCKTLSQIYPEPNRKRSAILGEARKIRSFIQKQLLDGRIVSLKNLKVKYKNYKLTDACLCNHMAIIRKGLAKDGYSFKKTGAGAYCLKN